MAYLVQHQYSRLNSILLGTHFKYYSFRNLRYLENHSSVLETLHKYPNMPEIKKKLSNLNINNIAKAAGPDAVLPVVLKKLSTDIAPAVAVIFQKT